MSTEKEVDRAWVEVDLGNLIQNARAVSRAAGDATLLPMVKADGYGLGVRRVTAALEAVDPWGFGVATVTEGVELRIAGVNRPIVVFTPVRSTELDRCREHDLIPVLEDLVVIREWGGERPYHCEIDTGMGRAGIRWDDLVGLATVVETPPQGVFTHLHSADTSPDSVNLQLDRFHGALAAFPTRPPLIHVANSAGAWTAPQEFDLARPGIFLYGGAAGPDLPRPERVASVRATLVSVRRLKAGDTVSYGAEWRAEQETTVGTLAIGYADGVPRAIQQHGQASALIRGRRCPIVGRVTMDMTMVDLGLAGLGAVEAGEIATVIGADGDGEITLDEFAGWAGTISYEILVKLGTRLPRTYRGP